MAHVGQEVALGLVGGFRRLACGNQFRGAARHQFLKMVPVRIQFEAETLLLGNIFLHRHIMRDRPVGLAQRRDDGEFDELAAVLALVVEFAFPGQAMGQ